MKKTRKTTTPDSRISDESLRDALMCLPVEEVQWLLAGMNKPELRTFFGYFGIFAHLHQRVPAVAQNGEPWLTWLILGGRGAGKTRAGAEWVREAARNPAARIALIGETMRDVRDVMVEGVSGLLAVHDAQERPEWSPTRGRLEWRSGAIAECFSAEDPDSLRGPQFSAAWCDELAKWRHAEATFDMLQFGLRLGTRPRQVITTTPRPIALLKRLIADPRTALTHAATAANAYNLAPAFLETIVGRYQGTQLGRQELDGEIIEERSGALWRRAQLEACRVAAAPACSRIVVAVDPPGSAGKESSACGLVAAGRHGDLFYVLADETAAGLSPAGWANKASAVAQARGGLPRPRGEPGWRHGARGHPQRGCERAGHAGARASRQVSARRAHRGALRAGAREARRRVSRAGRRDVRFRPRRFVVRPLAGPLDALVWAVSALTTVRLQSRVRVL